MTQPYEGPERRVVHVSADDVLELAGAVGKLNERVGRMTIAIATLGEVQERQTALEEEQERLRRDTVTKQDLAEKDKQRRSRFWYAVTAISVVLIAAAVAITVLVYALRREHDDFVNLRNQSVASCQIRNAQAQNSIDFYKGLGQILIEAQKQKSTPALDAAVAQFTKAVKTVPAPVDCLKIAQVGH